MKQFPPYHNSGKTETSKWNDSKRHPKKNRLPEITNKFEVPKGIIYLTKEAQKEYFPHLQ